MKTDLKKSFITGLFVILPLVVSAGILYWFFIEADAFFSPVVDRFVVMVDPTMRHIPGTGLLVGLIVILTVGLVARNVVGARLIVWMDRLIDQIPGFRTIYVSVKQLANAFSPDNAKSFKEVLLIEHPRAGSYALGFRTGTTVGDGGLRFAVVFIPTNHLYLGDIVFIPEETAVRLDLSVEQAVKFLISGGIAVPETLRRVTNP